MPKLSAMKKRSPFLTSILLTLLISTACHFHNGHKRTVRVNNDNTTLKIEYCGEVFFNEDETAIEEISPDGYVKYKRNGKRFIAESDEDGNISYKLYNGDRYVNYTDDNAKEFIADAVREIAAHYNR